MNYLQTTEPPFHMNAHTHSIQEGLRTSYIEMRSAWLRLPHEPEQFDLNLTFFPVWFPSALLAYIFKAYKRFLQNFDNTLIVLFYSYVPHPLRFAGGKHDWIIRTSHHLPEVISNMFDPVSMNIF
jgi:hypothetical protein